MSGRKAASYADVAAFLDDRQKRGSPMPTTREIRAAFDGQGSLSTYHEFLARWKNDSQSGTGVQAILACMLAEQEAHAASMQLHIGRLGRAIAALTDSEQAAVERDNENDWTHTSAMEWDYGDELPFSEQLARENAMFAEIASQSVARFIDEVDDDGEGYDLSPTAWLDRAQHDHSAPVPNPAMQQPSEDMLLSRHDTDGLRPVLALVPNQPVAGESNTDGGSSDGEA